MARFHYLEVAPTHKRLLVVFDKHGDDIPKKDDGTFCIPVVIPEKRDDGAVKTPGTGRVVFGNGKASPPEKSARFQLQHWLEIGFMPNNICMVQNQHPKLADRYYVQVWLDRETPRENQKTFADFGELGNYALGLIGAIHSACRVYDNGDSFSVNMAGVELELRIDTQYHELKASEVSSAKPAPVAKAVPNLPSKVTVLREVKAVATPVSTQPKPTLTLVAPTRAPTAIELALMKAVKK